MRRFRSALTCLAAVAGCTAMADVYDLKADWNEGSNPNGVWSFTEGENLLPHVDWWQRNLGGWAIAQPGWAKSEDGNNRLPFYFRSNGSETFAHDFVAGDIVCHSWDPTNGVGTTHGKSRFTAPRPARVNMAGNTWMGRDIGRSNDWFLFVRGVQVSTGSIASGDAYSRAVPMDFSAGSGGAAALTGHLLDTGDRIDLEYRTTSVGDFVGINHTVTETKVFQRAAPGSVAVKLGKLTAGSLTSLLASDGNAFKVCKFVVPNQSAAPVNVEVSGTSPIANPTEFVFRLRAHTVNGGQFQQTLELFDQQAGVFDPTDVSVAPINTVYGEQDVVGTGTLSRYVGAGSAVKARYRVRAVGATAVALWCHEADKAVWMIAP